MSTRLDRLIHMDAFIRSGIYPSVQTFCQRFEVQTRTVYEDTRLLKERYRAPLKYSNAHRGYFCTDTTWQLPAMMVTKGQLLAFFLSVELAERYLGTAFEQPLRDAIHQLFRLLPDIVEVSVRELAKHYSVRSASFTADRRTTGWATYPTLSHWCSRRGQAQSVELWTSCEGT